MKKLFILLLTFNFWLSTAQSTNETEKVLEDIITSEVKSAGSVGIVSKPVPKMVDQHLAILIHTKDRIFYGSENTKESIRLSEKERDSIIKTVRKSYLREWKKQDFKKYDLVEKVTATGYLQNDFNQRNLVLLTAPVFIRNGEIAIVFFGNINKVMEYAHSDLSFYRKQNGIWKKWISISSRTEKK